MPRYTAGGHRMRERDYRTLAAFRQRIRAYLRFSEQAARDAGLEPQQYQLLLAVKGLPGETKPTIRELASRLMIEHHSAVGLIDRLVTNSLVERRHDAADQRQIIVQLTSRGNRLIDELASYHAAELRKTAPDLIESLSEIIGTRAGVT